MYGLILNGSFEIEKKTTLDWNIVSHICNGMSSLLTHTLNDVKNRALKRFTFIKRHKGDFKQTSSPPK